MPLPSSPADGFRLSRRAALAALVATVGGVVVGCTSPPEDRRGKDSAPRPPEPSVDPDVAVAAEALANQRQVLALLEATRERHPRLAGDLAPAIAAHQAHADMLSDAVPPGVPVRPSLSPSPAASTGGSHAPSPSAADESTSAGPGEGNPGETAPTLAVPRKRARALAQVVAAERELATSTKRHAFRAESGAFARLLGSMAAASAQYAVVLSAKGRSR